MTIRAHFRQADIRRAIKAAQSCGCESVKVRIDTSGKMEVIVGKAANDESEPVELD